MDLPRGTLHKLKPPKEVEEAPPPKEIAPGIYEMAPPTLLAPGASIFECGATGPEAMAYGIGFDEYPPADILANLPPHDVCADCFPEDQRPKTA